MKFHHASNLVLTGDELCVRKKQNCTIKCTNYLCVFLFTESQNITIQYLTVVYSKNNSLKLRDQLQQQVKHDFTAVTTITAWIFALTEDVRINSLHLVGYDGQITVYNPRGQFEVIGSQFSQL